MRTVFLILGTMILLAGGFGVYWFTQPADVVRNDAANTAARRQAKPMAETDSTYTVRGGKNVWLKQFDESRRRTSQFRAEEFNPQKDGSVLVKKPEAHFFLKGGQWIRVTGETGDVIVSNMPEAGSDPFASGGAATPSRGRLQNVHLQLYETADAAAPTLDMEMNNAAFDNESFRIFTEAYTDESGKQISADQVKVTVRGKYEFDGRGLTIRWNDLDRRLELLEIAHGERLVVKEPGNLRTGMPGPDAVQGTGNGRGVRRKGEAGAKQALAPEATDLHRPTGRVTSVTRNSPDADSIESRPVIALASADASAAAGAISRPAAPATRESNSTVYSIWFYDNVQVVQQDQTLATGSVIEVYYAMRDEPDRPTTAPIAEASETAPPSTGAPERIATPQAAAPVSDVAAQTQPADQVEQPIIIYWTGKLRIVPSESGPPVHLAGGQSAVQMRGAPVILTRENVEIRCPAFTYRTTDGGVALHNSDAFPQVEITQFANLERTGKPALTLLSEWVEYAPEDGVATLGGKSRAIFPADESGKSEATAQAAWTREGVAHFTGSGDKIVMQSLDLNGDVDVRHPQLSLKSQRLNLMFDPPAPTTPVEAVAEAKAKATQPVVRHIVADGDVHCVLEDESGVSRELHGNHLEIATASDPAGRLYAETVNARGNVIAKDAERELAAQELALLLAPAPPKKKDPAGVEGKRAAKDPAKLNSSAVVLKRMVAKTGVRAVTTDADVATGDTLVVTSGPDGETQVGLSGKPAKIENAKGTVLTSEKIVIPNGDEAQAVGTGTLHAVVENKDKSAAPRHMDVNWKTSALVNSKLTENQVQIVGDVKATMPDEDGTINTSAAERMLITLVDKPADPGAAATTRKTKKNPDAKDADGTLAATDMDVMKGKEVGRILLNEDVVVTSRLSAADGSVLREMRMVSSLLEYDVPSQHLTVPRPGRMLVRDHRPADTKPAGAESTEGGLSTQRGATAFQWSETLDYSGVEKRATMKGGVIVAYKPDDENEAPVNLRANEVIATFEAAPKQPAGIATADGKAPAVQLQSVRAEGDVIVVRGVEELTAPRLTFDPVTHWIRATGNAKTPAFFSSTGRNGATSAREFQWNTDTWKIRVIDAAGRASGQ